MNSSRVGEHSHDSATLATERTREKPFPLRSRLPTFQWYYFSRVFRPCSLASKPWCNRALQAYIYSSSYCHMAFERIPIVVLCMKPPGKTTNLCILTCLSIVFYVSFRQPTVAFSSTCNDGQSYLRETVCRAE